MGIKEELPGRGFVQGSTWKLYCGSLAFRSGLVSGDGLA